VAVFDPHVSDERITNHGFEVTSGDDLSGFDLAAILTDHSGLPYEAIAGDVPLVFDARGVYRRLGLEAPNVEPL
jgi:UDP-N-acetyl-D-mannosaminuronate dehydrogenase